MIATPADLRGVAWTPALIAEACALLALGLSYREAGARLGVSRQAFASGISRHAPEARRNIAQARRKQQRVNDGPKARLWLADALVARPPGGCAWPIGDTTSRRFRFCGCAVENREPEERRGLYCEAHLAVAYLRADETQADRDNASGVSA